MANRRGIIETHITAKFARQWPGEMYPVNSPGVLRVSRVTMAGSSWQQQKIPCFHRVRLAIYVQKGFAFCAVNQKIVAMVFPVHVMASCTAVVAESQRIEIAS